MKFSEYDFPTTYDGPLKKQIETVAFLIKWKYAYVLSTMGTGKTLSCLWAIDLLMLNRKIKRVLVVAPLSTLQSVWVEENYTHIKTRKSILLHHPNRKIREQLAYKDADIYIINHDGIKVLEWEIINEIKPDIIVIDELTAFRNKTSDRTQCMIRINKIATAVWGLTGSMTANKITDAYGQGHCVNPYNPMLPKYYTRFRNLLTISLDEYTDIPRDNWESILKPMIQPAIRFTMEDLMDLPPIVYEPRWVEMTAIQKRVYKDMKDEYIAQIDDDTIKASNAGVKVMKLAQISSGAVFNTEGKIVDIKNSNKLNEVMEIYNQLDIKKLIIFCNFRACLEYLHYFMGTKGVSSEIVYGGVPAKKRGLIFKDFQKGKLQVLIMQPNATAHGLTLHASNTILWFGPITSNEIFQQANHRIRRPGQKRKQLVILLGSSPIEKRMYSSLRSKENLNRKFLDLIKNA